MAAKIVVGTAAPMPPVKVRRTGISPALTTKGNGNAAARITMAAVSTTLRDLNRFSSTPTIGLAPMTANN
jgi:hypothetical protein